MEFREIYQLLRKYVFKSPNTENLFEAGYFVFSILKWIFQTIKQDRRSHWPFVPDHSSYSGHGFVRMKLCTYETEGRPLGGLKTWWTPNTGEQSDPQGELRQQHKHVLPINEITFHSRHSPKAKKKKIKYFLLTWGIFLELLSNVIKVASLRSWKFHK